jgi:hypothetical protein
VGGILYKKFSADMEKVSLSTLNATAAAEKAAKNLSSQQQSAAALNTASVQTVSSNTLTNNALVKGSDVTAIAKKVIFLITLLLFMFAI